MTDNQKVSLICDIKEKEIWLIPWYKKINVIFNQDVSGLFLKEETIEQTKGNNFEMLAQKKHRTEN